MPDSKPNLAKLFAQLALFIPQRDHKSGKWSGKFLVNQMKVEQYVATETYRKGETGCPPDRDDLLHMIGMASGDLRLFMDEHDANKRELESVKGRHDQMVSLLQQIAIGDIDAQHSAEAYLNFKPERFQETLVNQNLEYRRGFKDGVKYLLALQGEFEILDRISGDKTDEDLTPEQLEKFKAIQKPLKQMPENIFARTNAKNAEDSGKSKSATKKNSHADSAEDQDDPWMEEEDQEKLKNLGLLLVNKSQPVSTAKDQELSPTIQKFQAPNTAELVMEQDKPLPEAPQLIMSMNVQSGQWESKGQTYWDINQDTPKENGQ